MVEVDFFDDVGGVIFVDVVGIDSDVYGVFFVVDGVVRF